MCSLGSSSAGINPVLWDFMYVLLSPCKGPHISLTLTLTFKTFLVYSQAIKVVNNRQNFEIKEDAHRKCVMTTSSLRSTKPASYQLARL